MRMMEIAAALLVAGIGVACDTAQSAPESRTKKSAQDCEARTAAEARNLATFDDLDYNVFSKQAWARLDDSHTKDIEVHWPDGHTTTGLAKHTDDLKAMFVYAPDTRIKEHPIKIAEGEWTAVMGIMEGTFTRPMKMPDGTVIRPTGKKFKLPMATIGHWNKDGVMDAEYLFWDNLAFMTQIGAAKK